MRYIIITTSGLLDNVETYVLEGRRRRHKVHVPNNITLKKIFPSTSTHEYKIVWCSSAQSKLEGVYVHLVKKDINKVTKHYNSFNEMMLDNIEFFL